MRLCMFHPGDHPMERGWVGRIDGDRVLHLAAQTLQSFFTGGATAREHAEYALAEIRFLVPVLHPPTVRIFDGRNEFAFANASAVVGPDAAVAGPAARLTMLPRLAAVIGAHGAIGGFSALAEWRAPGLRPPKDRDFALALGPVVVTPDELTPHGLDVAVCCSGDELMRARIAPFDWEAACEFAAAGTQLRPGDVIAGPAFGAVDGLAAGPVELEVEGIGVLGNTTEPRAGT